MIYQFRAGVYIYHFKFNLLESLRPLWLLPTRWGLSPVTVPVLARPPPRQTPPFNASERPGLLQKVDAGPGMEQGLCCSGMAIPCGQVQWCQGKPFLHWGKKMIKLEEGARFHRAGKRVTWPSICIRPSQTCTVFRKYLHVQEMISRNDSRPLQLLLLGACTCRKRWRFGLFMALDSANIDVYGLSQKIVKPTAPTTFQNLRQCLRNHCSTWAAVL